MSANRHSIRENENEKEKEKRIALNAIQKELKKKGKTLTDLSTKQKLQLNEGYALHLFEA